MTDIERSVARHYGDADLLARILAGLEASGADPDRPGPDDLAPVDEFHIGGRKATEFAVARMSLAPDHHVLDVGCGIGGATRYMASRIGCRVTGIDLTPEYISTAESLTAMTGLSDRVTFHVASALDMPFERAAFDAAITFHVAMNIPERVALYGEIARVMKPGATLCVYDVMKKGDEDITFPVPWAETSETSHLTTPEEMHTLLEEAGFSIHEVEDRTDFALDFFKTALAAMADGPPPLGLHLVLGESGPEKFKNMLDNVQTGRIAPVQMIARRGAR